MTADRTPWTTDPQVRDDDALRGVLEVLADQRARPVPADVRHRHLTAMLAEARPPVRRRGLRHRVRDVLALTGVKVALAVGVAAAGTTTGMAATGTLPDTAQQVAHEIGARIGVGVPAAPGQRKQADGDPDSTGRDHAPGQVARTDPDRRARDLAPGRVGRDGRPGQRVGQSDDAPGQSDDAPGRSGDAPGRG